MMHVQLTPRKQKTALACASPPPRAPRPAQHSQQARPWRAGLRRARGRESRRAVPALCLAFALAHSRPLPPRAAWGHHGGHTRQAQGTRCGTRATGRGECAEATGRRRSSPNRCICLPCCPSLGERSWSPHTPKLTLVREVTCRALCVSIDGGGRGAKNCARGATEEAA